MSKTKISPEQRARIAEAAGYRCGYCLTQEIVIGMPLVVDHIIPEAKGGTSEDDNLWLACRRCNEFKGVQTSAVDPETGETVIPSPNPSPGTSKPCSAAANIDDWRAVVLLSAL